MANGATVAAGYAIDDNFLNRLVQDGNAFNINMAVASGNNLDEKHRRGRPAQRGALWPDA